MIDNLKIDRDKMEASGGPIMKRTCTDWWMAIVFILFCVGLVAAAIYGFVAGKPDQLLIGWDGDR